VDSQANRALRPLVIAWGIAFALLGSGCTSMREWWHNGFKVGPNYHQSDAAVASRWIDDADGKVKAQPQDCGKWWSQLDDPILDSLIEGAVRQNLDLRTAGARILESRAKRNIAAGNLFPQFQQALAANPYAQISKNIALQLPHTLHLWATGFNASWELDFWGRFRRAIEAADADLSASVYSYNDALVLLLSEVATNYVQARIFQQRLAFARRNEEIQQGSLEIAELRFKKGAASELDVQQARSVLTQTKATIPPLRTGLRQANNRLCILLGVPPYDLIGQLDPKPIPTAPPSIAIGIPAELLRRRPDIRRAEREVASQSAQIGIATSDLYPRLALFGFIGYASEDLKNLFSANSFTSLLLPTFQWQILNYGRILNNIRAQDARFQAKVFEYQQAVLRADQEVEDGIVAFLQAQEQSQTLEESVQAAERTVELVVAQYRRGAADFNRVYNAQALLVTQQDQLVIARGNITLSMVAIYKALGGGWEWFSRHPQSDSCRPVETNRGAGFPSGGIVDSAR
jgi:NodT family efflux transporter outer membrane factor (OMF) lipoprotein